MSCDIILTTERDQKIQKIDGVETEIYVSHFAMWGPRHNAENQKFFRIAKRLNSHEIFIIKLLKTLLNYEKQHSLEKHCPYASLIFLNFF